MTKAADTGGTVPTASVVARGKRESSHPYRSPNHAAKAIPAAMMITKGQSISSRSSLMQVALDVLAVLFGAFLILLLALCVAAAPLFLLFLFLMFV